MRGHIAVNSAIVDIEKACTLAFLLFRQNKKKPCKTPFLWGRGVNRVVFLIIIGMGSTPDKLFTNPRISVASFEELLL